MGPDDGARSGSRPRRWSRAKRSRVCRTWSRRRDAGGGGKTRARRRCAAYRRQGRRRAGGRLGCRASAGSSPGRAGSGMVALIWRPAQVRPDRGAGIGLVAQDPPGPGPGPSRPAPGDLQLIHQRDEGQRVVPLPGAGQPGQRPAPGVGQQMDLAGQPAPRPAQRLPVLVIRLLAPRAGRGAQRRGRQPRRIDIAAEHAGLPPHADAPGPPWHLPPPSRPGRGLIAPGPQPIQDHLPGPVAGPAAMPVINRLPVPGPLRQVPPRVARSGSGGRSR